MADHLPGPEAETWIRWAFGGMATVALFVAGWLKSSINEVRKDSEARDSATDTKLDEWIEDQSEMREKVAETYATKQDLRDLAHELKEDRERNRRDMIAMLTGMERRITTQIKLQIAASQNGGGSRH